MDTISLQLVIGSEFKGYVLTVRCSGCHAHPGALDGELGPRGVYGVGED
jgi:hypothetical protein